jgi:Icc-related predicted phosphoesterase
MERLNADAVNLSHKMNLLIIADDEFAALRVPEIQADILISLGDLPDGVILQVAKRCGCGEILAVKGNHDSSSPFPAPIRDLHRQTFAIGGVTFGGFCGAWKYKPKGNYLFEQHEVEEQLADFPAVDIFLAHNSPRLIHDRDDEVHLGFVAFNHYLTRAKPFLFLHGHQHHEVKTKVDSTTVIGTFGYRLLSFPE